MIVTVASARTTHLRLEGMRLLLSLTNGFRVRYLALVGIAATSLIFALIVFPDVRAVVVEVAVQLVEVPEAIYVRDVVIV